MNPIIKSSLILSILFLIPTVLRADDKKIDSLINKSKEVVYSNPRQSLYFSQRALDIIPLDDSEKRALALYWSGHAYKLIGDFDLAIKTLYDALDYCPPSDNSLYVDILIQISNIYCRLKDYSKAFEINDKATALSKTYQDSLRLAASFNNRGIIHYHLNEFSIADQFFRNALQINRNKSNIKAVAANLNNMCLYKGNIDEKLTLIKEAIVINKNLNAIWPLAENYNNMGKQYYFAHQYSKALETLQIAMEYAKEVDAKELMCDNYEYSSWVFAAMKQYDKAYEYLLKLYNMSLELQSNQKLRSVEQEIFEKRVLDLKKEKELKEKNYKIELLNRNMLVLFVLLVLFIFAGLFLSHWTKRRKDLQLAKTQYQLEQSERELAELKIKEQESALINIRKELDSTSQEVTSYAMFLRSRNELLSTIREQIKEGLKMNPDELQTYLKKVNAFILQHQNSNDKMTVLLNNIEQRNTDFITRLTEKHPNLTQGEKYLATLLRINLSTKEISLITGAIPKTINMNRYRLRKTLELQSEDSLTEYLQKI